MWHLFSLGITAQHVAAASSELLDPYRHTPSAIGNYVTLILCKSHIKILQLIAYSVAKCAQIPFTNLNPYISSPELQSWCRKVNSTELLYLPIQRMHKIRVLSQSLYYNEFTWAVCWGKLKGSWSTRLNGQIRDTSHQSISWSRIDQLDFICSSVK